MKDNAVDMSFPGLAGLRDYQKLFVEDLFPNLFQNEIAPISAKKYFRKINHPENKSSKGGPTSEVNMQ